MTKEEYFQKKSELRVSISDLENQIKLLDKEYIKLYSPFKPGDKVRVDDCYGVINKVILDGSGHFCYLWNKIKKNGSLYQNTSKIYSFEVKHIELIEKGNESKGDN